MLTLRFEAPAPNRVWLADISVFATGEGWLYLAVALDLATRRVAGWAMRDHMRVELALAALMMAVQRQRPAPGILDHSDSGSQSAAEVYADQFAAIDAIAYMSRTATVTTIRPWRASSIR